MACGSRLMPVSETKLSAAYAECRRLARRHYENFPTASCLVPRDKRDALAAIYAFARYADDVADEPGVENRLEKLADWRAELDASYEGSISHPVFLALQDSAQRFHLSRENFENLLRAFESDVVVNRHRDFVSLLAYCTCSANPVGRLVLYACGEVSEENFRLSDATCSALQLANFWQDVKVDWQKDRVYIPQADMRRFGVTDATIAAGVATPEFRDLLKYEVEYARSLFEQGLPLIGRVNRELALDLDLFSRGGLEILNAIERQNYDVLSARPAIGKSTKVQLALRAVTGKFFPFLRLGSKQAPRGAGKAA